MSHSQNKITRHFRDYASRKAIPLSSAELIAVYKTIEVLQKEGRDDILAAIKDIYFVFPSRRLRRGEISERALAFSREYHADVSTVYRWLREARRLWRYFYEETKRT